jgi:hypothetical protein
MYFGFGGRGDECFPFKLNQAGAIEWDEYTFYNGERVPVKDQRLVWCACGLDARGADAASEGRMLKGWHDKQSIVIFGVREPCLRSILSFSSMT